MKNLFLSGSPGLGKTFLSACIARVVSERGYSVVYDTAIHVFGRFEAEKFGREENGSTLRYLKCDLLILDDLGSELTTPFIQSAQHPPDHREAYGDFLQPEPPGHRPALLRPGFQPDCRRISVVGVLGRGHS